MIKMPNTTLILSAVGAIGLLALAFSWHSRGQRLDAALEIQASIVESATLATVAPRQDGTRERLDPSQVSAAIAGLKSSQESAVATLAAISEVAATGKAQAVVADKALARENEVLRGEFAAAEVKIIQLEEMQGSGSLEEQCRVADLNSKTAWSF